MIEADESVTRLDSVLLVIRLVSLKKKNLPLKKISTILLLCQVLNLASRYLLFSLSWPSSHHIAVRWELINLRWSGLAPLKMWPLLSKRTCVTFNLLQRSATCSGTQPESQQCSCWEINQQDHHRVVSRGLRHLRTRAPPC